MSNGTMLSNDEIESILSRLVVASLYLLLYDVYEEISTKCLEFISECSNRNRTNRPKESTAIIQSLILWQCSQNYHTV